MACCVAVGCSNRSDRKDLSFYRFPKDPDRREKWIAAVKRKNWSPTDYSRLCSRHFVSGEKSNNPLSPDYIPSLFAYNSAETKTKKRASEIEEPLAMTRKKRDQNERLTAATVLLNLSMAAARAADAENNNDHSDQKQQTDQDEEESDQPDPHEEDSDQPDLQEEDTDQSDLHEEHPGVAAKTDTIEPASEAPILNNETSQTDVFSDHNYCMSSATLDKGTQCHTEPLYKDLLRTDALCHLYTGLPLTTFNLLAENILPFSNHIFELDPTDQLLMTLMKLKLNLLQEYLAERFHICPSSVSTIVTHWVDLMETHMKSYIPWLQKETIVETMPQCFREHYPGTTCIIDFSEIGLKIDRHLSWREESHRHYDDKKTVKFMVAFAPCGLIMFISAAYGEECSDRFITSDSGFLKHLHPLDEVMAVQRFTITDVLKERGVKLTVPVFTKRGIRLSDDDATHSTSITDVRIHVERMTCRLKQFKILSESMPSSLTSKVHQILRICAALCNLRGDNFHEVSE